MATLREMIGSGEKRKAVIDDALRVLDAEVDDKSGFSGVAIKTAYKVVKGISPGFIRKVVDDLLNEFLDALDPIYQEALQKKVAPGSYLEVNAGRMAEALLAITDRRAARTKQALLKKTYDRLRPLSNMWKLRRLA